MLDFDASLDQRIDFYEQNYAIADLPPLYRPDDKLFLTTPDGGCCRFCGGNEPAVSFKKKAHAIPKSLGNRSLFSMYECDSCNALFGTGIENDLGNWSKPGRTFARIRGDRGVPTLKRETGSGPKYRIQYKESKFHISHYEDDPAIFIDTEKRRVTFILERDPYTPIAVLKAFVRIGLTIIPHEELVNFADTLGWIRELDHSARFIEKCPIVSTFIPGPMPSDLTFVSLLRRRVGVADLPYAFLILGYGNNVYQVCLPSPKQDQIIRGKELKLPPFPTPDGP